jgi:integrase
MSPEPIAMNTWIYVSECLYRKCEGGTIYFRVRQNGNRRLRSTKTNDPVRAKKVLKRWRDEQWAKSYGAVLPGPQVQERMLTMKQMIADYISAGYPTKKMRKKAPSTVIRETYFLKPLLEWWGEKNPSAVDLADCDSYREWRNSGGFVSSYKLRGHPKKRNTVGGDRAVDMELDCLSNVFHLARRRGKIKHHPLMGRGKYTSASDVRHCREVAPDPKGLTKLDGYFCGRDEHDIADCTLFMAYSGLRIGEALARHWTEVNDAEGIIDAKRQKRGIFPWVIITPELAELLARMRQRRLASGVESELLFPSPFDPAVPRDQSAIRSRIKTACQKLGIRHVTPHGLRSFYVTSARESGLTDAEIAMLIGDKTGPSLIASTYGDVRPEHLVRQAQRIRFRHHDAEV